MHDGRCRPVPTAGQPWAYQRIAEGDTTCADNQALHPEAADLLGKIRANDHYVPEVADPLSPITFVDKINVPVFMACQWTDEQTGGHCPTLAEHMTGTDKKWFTYTNGTHVDSLDPETYNRLYDFFEIYVAQQAPIAQTALDPGQRAGRLPGDLRDQAAIRGMRRRHDAAARPDPGAADLRPRQGGVRGAAADPRPVRQRRRQLAIPAGPTRASSSRSRASRSRAPRLAPGTWRPTARSPTAPAAGTRADAFTWDAHARPLTDFTGDTGAGAGRALDRDAALPVDAGPGPARRRLRDRAAERGHDRGRRRRAWTSGCGPPTPNVDLQATISEVRPDGKETFVQNGWVRANERKLDAAKSTRARAGPQPARGGRRADALRPVRAGHDPALLRGARLSRGLAHPRQDLGAQRRPADLVVRRDRARRNGGGRDRLRQRDAVAPRPPAGAGRRPCPTALPPCPGLRGEPCRDYEPFENAAG